MLAARSRSQPVARLYAIGRASVHAIAVEDGSSRTPTAVAFAWVVSGPSLDGGGLAFREQRVGFRERSLVAHRCEELAGLAQRLP